MNLFDFSQYRLFLEKHIRTQPRQGWGYLSQLAKIVGISATQMSQVLHRQKDLTVEQAHRLTVHLGFSAEETEYFMDLVHAERAGTTELKKYYQEKIRKARDQALDVKRVIPPTHEMTEEQRSRFYSDWRYSAIRLFCSIGDGQSLEQISRVFRLPLPHVKERVDFLVDAGLCVREGGRCHMGPQRTFVSPGSSGFYQHQTNWRLRALTRAKDSSSKTEIFFTSPVSLSAEDFERLSARMREWIREFSETVRDSPAEKVVCLNLDFFEVGE